MGIRGSQEPSVQFTDRSRRTRACWAIRKIQGHLWHEFDFVHQNVQRTWKIRFLLWQTYLRNTVLLQWMQSFRCVLHR